MKLTTMDGQLFKSIVINGAANLRANYKKFDALNVFPVPDGDTGINMRMTIEAGASSIKDNDDTSIYDVSKKLSKGMLMGARGNSGVILSQLFRGLYKGLENKTEVDALELAEAFRSGYKQAYKAVMKPVEGTILTVVREAAEETIKKISKKTSINDFFNIYIKEANKSLDNTPNILKVLKEANVVDSGGAGYVCVIEGMKMALEGKFITDKAQEMTTHVVKHNFNADSELVYGYCTEFILQLQNAKVDVENFDVTIISDFLQSIGDSVVALKDEDIVKVHVHTKTPGLVFTECQKYGEYITLKIENMHVQHSEETAPLEQCDCEECVEMRKSLIHKKYAVVAVASGEGLVNTFKEMGVDYVVSGGQTMNPSSEDFVTGFGEIDAENIIVFPNNSNIILAATQAAKYYDKAKVFVAPTKSIAQGYSALTMLDFSSDDIDTILEEVNSIISNVTTGLITYSIRNAEIEGVKINEGEYIGICNGKIVTSKIEKADAVFELLASVEDIEEKEIITIIYGEDIDKETAENIGELIENKYTNLEVELINGKQSVYSYILSIE